MPLRDTEPHREWLERERPSPTARLVVAEFLVTAGSSPWAAPSTPIEQLCERPVHEAREVTLGIPGEPPVWMLYRHFYDGDAVDIVAIAQQPTATDRPT